MDFRWTLDGKNTSYSHPPKSTLDGRLYCGRIYLAMAGRLQLEDLTNSTMGGRF